MCLAEMLDANYVEPYVSVRTTKVYTLKGGSLGSHVEEEQSKL